MCSALDVLCRSVGRHWQALGVGSPNFDVNQVACSLSVGYRILARTCTLIVRDAAGVSSLLRAVGSGVFSMSVT